MTPQLQQAIKLLALSNVDVEAFIAEEVERNPLLETVQDGPEYGEADPQQDFIIDERSGNDGIIDPSAPGIAEAALDVDYNAESFRHQNDVESNVGQDQMLNLNGVGGSSSGSDGESFDFDTLASNSLSLLDHLQAQARAILSGSDLLIANQIIEQLDEAAYLNISLLELANRMGAPLALVERILHIIHGFEPTGVGARSLAECLRLQAQEVDRFDPAMARLIDNLDLLAQGRLTQLKRICSVDDEDLTDMIRELRAYDPKPGLRFSNDRTATVTPDVFVSARGQGWAIEINNASLPRVLVNRSYYNELTTQGAHKPTSAWLNEALTNANWLVKALDQRQRTILKVVTEIVKHQDAFFRYGVSGLKPLTLKMVADVIEMHESTVSRVTSNKYLSCARGVYELKYFFTNAVGGNDGSDVSSAAAVRDAIKILIAAESPTATLSDDQLVDLLRNEGHDIARRTVAKYREALGLGSSVQRRRAKLLAR